MTGRKAKPRRRPSGAVKRKAARISIDDETEDQPQPQVKRPVRRGNGVLSPWLVEYDNFDFDLGPLVDYRSVFSKHSTAHYTWAEPKAPPKPSNQSITSINTETNASDINSDDTRVNTPADSPPPQRNKIGSRQTKARKRKDASHPAAQGGSHVASVHKKSSPAASAPAMSDQTTEAQKVERNLFIIRDALILEEASPTPEPPIGFLSLPTEIRTQIYHHLLVAEQPIQVHCYWTMVYIRSRPELWPHILRTCKLIAMEALPVLYGCNTFEYRIRDPLPKGMKAHRRRNNADEEGGNDRDSDISEVGTLPYGKQTLDIISCAGRLPRGSIRHGEILLHKFGYLFRNIAITLEGNRTEPGYEIMMAEAIAIFRSLPPEASSESESAISSLTGHRRAALRSITIEICPRRDEQTNELLFVDFFAPESPIMRQIRLVQCQFLTVRVNLVDKRVVPIKLDMRHAMPVSSLRGRRVSFGAETDIWSHDKIVQLRREKTEAEIRTALICLPRKIKEWCEEYEKATDRPLGQPENHLDLDTQIVEY
jgi:hypothetical protein